MSDASKFAERLESERESWRQYQRNRRETDVVCPDCGGRATKATIHGQTDVQCHEKGCLFWEILD